MSVAAADPGCWSAADEHRRLAEMRNWLASCCRLSLARWTELFGCVTESLEILFTVAWIDAEVCFF